MSWDIVPVTLSLVGVAVVVTLLLNAFTKTVDPLALTRCHDCQRWMLDTGHHVHPVCFRCRHSHHHTADEAVFHQVRH